MRKSLLVIITLVFALNVANGCAAALVGGGFYKSSKTKEQRQQFMTEFQKINMAREEKGLEPLDWCTEAYKFDEGWADNDKVCKERIKRYKAGDSSALNMDISSPNKIEK
jgi:hypothetical protein